MKNFNKILCTFIIALFASLALCTSPANARVRFLGDSTDEENFDTPSFGTNAEWCKSQGYNQTGECTNKNERPGRVCTRDSNYFDKCCNMAYNYKLCSYPNERSKDSCGGRYKCVCDKNLYPISNCPAPQIPSRDACTEDYFEGGNNTGKIYYSSCDCPHYYQACDGKNLMGDTAIEQECKGTYASCKCKDGFNKTCSDYGTKVENDTNYCYLNGTKWYTEGQCRSAAEFCAKQGYTNIACPGDEMAVQYCPQDSSYFLCRKDPAKYCPNKQFNGVGEFQKWGQCGKYKTQNQDKKCSYKIPGGSTIVFGDYYLCEESCKSQMYDNDYRPLSDGHENVQWYKMTTTASQSQAIILGKNLNFKSDTAFRDPYGNQYATIKGVTALYEENPSRYSKCQSSYYGTYYHDKSWCYHRGGTANIASINIKEGSGLNRNFKNLTIIMSLEQNGGQAIRRTFPITKTVDWVNVNLGYDYNDTAGTSKVHWYGDRLYAIQQVSLIDITGGSLYLTGTNNFCSGSDYNSGGWNDANSGQWGKHYAVKVNANAGLDILGSLYCDVSIYNHGWVDIWASGAQLYIGNTGIGSWDNGYTTVRNGANLSTYVLAIQGGRHMKVTSKSTAKVTSNKGASTYIGKDRNLCITGGSNFTTAGVITTCRRGEICLGSGFGTSIKVQSSTYSLQNRSYRRKDSSGCDNNANPVSNGWFSDTWNARQCTNRCGSASQ